MGNANSATAKCSAVNKPKAADKSPTCENCGSGEDEHEDNGVGPRSVEYTILCTACGHQWSPNDS